MNKENKRMLEIKKWTEIRKKGRERYILVNGVLKFGIPMGIIYPIIQQLVNLKYKSNNYTFDNLFYRLIVCIVVFSIGGCIMQNLAWKKFEKRYMS